MKILNKKLFKNPFIIAAVICGTALYLIVPHMPLTYSAKPISGKVVDANTGEPIEGAIVVAVWELKRQYNFEGSIIAGHIHVAEVLTNEAGEYHIHGWGPKWRPLGAYTTNSSPLLVIFKRGYNYVFKKNFWWSHKDIDKYKYRRVHRSDWDKKIIKLQRFQGDLLSYYHEISSIDGVLEPILSRVFGAGLCDWQKIPNLILALDEFYQKLVNEVDSRRTYHIPDVGNLIARGGCGTEEEFLRKHRQ